MSTTTKSDGGGPWPERAGGLSSRARRWTNLTAIAVAAPALLALSACSQSDSDSRPEAGGGTGASATPTDPVDSGDAAPDPTDAGAASQDTDPEPSSLPVPESVRDETQEASDDFVDAVEDVLEQPDSSRKTVPSVTGPALEDLQNRVTEYEASGWRVVGEAVIVRQKVVKYYKDPETAVVRACVDNSDVRVIDAKGQPVPGSTPSNPRTLNIFTLIKDDSGWVINESRLVARPDC